MNCVYCRKRLRRYNHQPGEDKSLGSRWVCVTEGCINRWNSYAKWLADKTPQYGEAPAFHLHPILLNGL